MGKLLKIQGIYSLSRILKASEAAFGKDKVLDLVQNPKALLGFIDESYFVEEKDLEVVEKVEKKIEDVEIEGVQNQADVVGKEINEFIEPDSISPIIDE